MRRLLLSVMLAAGLAACATPATVYGPAATVDAVGYRQQKIESDRYRVSFRANPDLRAPQVEDMALRRAGELTLQEGYEWFRVVNRFTEQVGGRPGGGTSVGVGGSSGSFGSSVGVGIGLDLSPDSRRYESTLEIVMGRGPKPEGGDVYDARSAVSRALGPSAGG